MRGLDRRGVQACASWSPGSMELALERSSRTVRDSDRAMAAAAAADDRRGGRCLASPAGRPHVHGDPVMPSACLGPCAMHLTSSCCTCLTEQIRLSSWSGQEGRQATYIACRMRELTEIVPHIAIRLECCGSVQILSQFAVCRCSRDRKSLCVSL